MSYKKQAISFGLVNIPVELNPVIKNNDTAFNLIYKKTGGRIKQQKVCAETGVVVDNKDIIKGYQYTPGNYVTFTDDDFSKLQAIGDNNIEIISFVDLKEIDPVYFEKSYYLTTKGSSKAFSLFKKALNKAGKVAIAKTVMGYKSYHVVLRFGKNHIIMNTLYFEEEVMLEEDTLETEFTKAELDMAIKLIESMSGKFEPKKYIDEYQNRIKAAIDKKIKGKALVKPKGKKAQNISNLMEALEKSIKVTK